MRLTIALGVVLLSAMFPASPQARLTNVESALAAMDKNARGLKTLSFRFRASPVDDRKAEVAAQGVVRVVGMATGDFEALVDMQKPKPSKIYYRGLEYRTYDPERKETTTEKLKDQAALVAVLKLLMPGTSGKRLSSAYNITVAGTENAGGTSAIRLTLEPKSKPIHDQVPKAEIWMPANGGFPVRLQVNFSGSRMRFDFSDIVVNARFPEGSVRLQ